MWFWEKDPAPKSVTIEYFAVHGMADPIVFLLTHAKVEYKRVNVEQADFAKMKAEGKGGEFGSLPRVHIDGKEYGQTTAILRSFGQRYGYYDASNMHCAAKCDVFVDAWADLLKISGLTLKVVIGGTKKEDLYGEFDKLAETVFHPILAALEK